MDDIYLVWILTKQKLEMRIGIIASTFNSGSTISDIDFRKQSDL